eukprot:gene11577-24218_t
MGAGASISSETVKNAIKRGDNAAIAQLAQNHKDLINSPITESGKKAVDLVCSEPGVDQTNKTTIEDLIRNTPVVEVLEKHINALKILFPNFDEGKIRSDYITRDRNFTPTYSYMKTLTVTNAQQQDDQQQQQQMDTVVPVVVLVPAPASSPSPSPSSNNSNDTIVATPNHAIDIIAPAAPT